MNLDIQKNKEELAREEACWNEIEEVLKKYNCRLEGTTSHYDFDNDYEYESKTDSITVESLDYDKRVEEANQAAIEAEKARALKEKEDLYQDLLKYSYLKDLVPFKIGHPELRHTWFKGLKLNEEKVKEPLFFWNGNKFWQYTINNKVTHGVSLIVGDKSDWSQVKGAPHFSFFSWEPYKEKDRNYAKWFTYHKHMDIRPLIDMYGICLIIDEMIKQGIIEIDEDAIMIEKEKMRKKHENKGKKHK